MLTDYHVHLRPDEHDGDPFEDHFTEANVDRYTLAAAKAGVADIGVSEHIYRFSQALELWHHPFWEEFADDDLDAYCEFVAASPLKLGIECDYVPGAEDRTAELLGKRPFDYVIGSVHFVGDKAVDMEPFTVWDGEHDADEIWERYFQMLAEAARSGLFDILAHPDLVKVWGEGRPGPMRDPRFYYEPAIEAILESGVAVEISTAGIRKPVGEIYPAPSFAGELADAGAVFALSSDAHIPEQIGFAYDQAINLMDDLGITKIATFEGRQRELVPIEEADREHVSARAD
jgi:histidinol-phosphatase (PHP family)